MKVTLTLLIAVLCVYLPLTTFAGDIKQDLVLYLPLDEGTGNTIKDASGSGNDGERHNAKWVDGKSGKAIECGGEDIWATVKDAPKLNFKAGESLTLACWTKMTGAWSGQGNIVAKYKIGGGTTPFYGMFVYTGDKIHTYTRDAGSTLVELWSKDSINDKEWHHIALVRDAGKKVSLYVDGELNESKPDNTGDLTNAEAIAIGRHTTSQYYTGIVDEVMLWRRPLNDTEIVTIVKSGIQTTVDIQGKLSTTWGRIKNY
jgi:hypothetical protein